MKIGICAWVLPGEEIESFKIAGDLGLDGVVIDFGQWNEDNALRTDYERQAYMLEAKKYGLEIPTIAVNTFCDRGMTKIDNLNYAKELLTDVIEIAAKMRVPNIQVPSFYDNLIRTDADLTNTIEAFRYVCEVAEKYNINVGTENVMTIAQHQKLYKRVTSKRLTTSFDTQNPWRKMNQDGVKLAEYMMPYISELHAKDSDPSIAGPVQLGDGDVRFDEIMTVFAENGFDGWIQLESNYGAKYGEMIPEDVKRLNKIFKGRKADV